jgi:hypothetical protein
LTTETTSSYKTTKALLLKAFVNIPVAKRFYKRDLDQPAKQVYKSCKPWGAMVTIYKLKQTQAIVPLVKPLLMPAKISEKQLFLGIVFLLAGLAILLSTKLVNSPVKISEKGLLLTAIAIALFFLSARFISRSCHRQ